MVEFRLGITAVVLSAQNILLRILSPKMVQYISDMVTMMSAFGVVIGLIAGVYGLLIARKRWSILQQEAKKQVRGFTPQSKQKKG